MKPTSGLQNIGLEAANKSDGSALASELSPTGALAPAGVESSAEIQPSRKRGAFLTGRFFSGKDKDLPVQPDERSDFVEPSATGGKEPPEGARETGPQLLIPGLANTVGNQPVPTLETVEANFLPNLAAPGSLTSKLALAAPDQPTPPPSEAPATHPRPFMTPNDPARSPVNHQALAELTIGFEVTSLQLTPYFKLGPLELRTLSNVVSLSLVAAQTAGQPLAAGISFQIVQVDLDDASRFKSLLLKPLGESREITAPRSVLQVDHVAMTSKASDAPIAVTASAQVNTPVQVFGAFIVAEIDFTPAFEIGSLRLTPASHTMRVRVAPSSLPAAQDPSLSFQVAEVRINDSAQMVGVRLLPVPVRNA